MYRALIQELTGCTSEEAPLVEGYLRMDYGTLDHLDRARFRAEAKRCLAEVRVDPRLAREVAQSYGLVGAGW
jgi:hypothetical protein